MENIRKINEKKRKKKMGLKSDEQSPEEKEE